MIVDLGIAKVLDKDGVTGDSGAPFTSGYAALEQIRYSRLENDIRTDQFPIGIILFQLLTKGQHPFDPAIIGGDGLIDNVVYGRWNHTALDQKHLMKYRYLISRLLGQYPHQRFRTQEELAAELDHCRRGLI